MRQLRSTLADCEAMLDTAGWASGAWPARTKWPRSHLMTRDIDRGSTAATLLDGLERLAQAVGAEALPGDPPPETAGITFGHDPAALERASRYARLGATAVHH